MKKTITLKTTGMHCKSCEKIIETILKREEGVLEVDSSYPKEETRVSFDDSLITQKEMESIIKEAGYEVFEEDKKKDFGFLLVGLGLIAIGIVTYSMFADSLNLNFNQIDGNTSLAILFLIGLMTGFHCIGMCGGFVLSYSSKKGTGIGWISHVLYGSGKTISYTLIGAFFGLIGSIFILTLEMRVFAAIIAGIFLIVYGLNMLNIFPILRQLRLSTPSFISRFISNTKKTTHGPLYLGLLNGLMIACGPLQAMYILAAGSGDVLVGAKLLLFFGLGTLPPLLGFGAIASILSKGLTHKIVRFSGVLVIFLGLLMINNGLTLYGSGFSFDSSFQNEDLSTSSLENAVILEDGFQVIYMNVTRYGWEPNKFILKTGIPVKWIINGKEINGCNNEIVVNEYGLKIPIEYGEQVVEFTPEEEGVVKWSCWMGMIPGVFIISDDIELSEEEIEQKITESGGISSGGSCSGSCGGGCGGDCGGGCGGGYR